MPDIVHFATVGLFAAVWVAFGVIAVRRCFKSGPVSPVGDALLGGVLLVTGPIGLAIILFCEWSLDSRP